jgi:hypothetical protein
VLTPEEKMPICECGCGRETKGTFCPGHDQSLRVYLEGMVGGLLHLRKLVEVAHDYACDLISLDEMGRQAKSLFSQK